MLKQITRTNDYGETKTLLFNTEDIALISEKHQEPVCLYNADGELVSSEEPKEKLFNMVLVLKNGHHVDYTITEETFNELSELLTK